MRSGVFAALAFAVALATAGCSEDNVGPAEVARVRASTDFDLYYVGASYRDFPLTKIHESPASAPYKSVTFWYGDCEPAGGEGACGYDFTMSVYDVCGRPFQLWELPISRLTNIRGVPSGEFGTGLEMYTGDSSSSAAVVPMRARAWRCWPSTGTPPRSSARSTDESCPRKISSLQ